MVSTHIAIVLITIWKVMLMSYQEIRRDVRYSFIKFDERLTPKSSEIRYTKSQSLLSQEWRCSWSSSDCELGHRARYSLTNEQYRFDGTQISWLSAAPFCITKSGAKGLSQFLTWIVITSHTRMWVWLIIHIMLMFIKSYLINLLVT